MTSYDYQRFVIGGVSAGVRAARVAAGLAARVAIAEDFKYGGTGFIRGCVPKKLLVYVLTPVAILVPLAAPSLSGLNERTLAKLIVDSASQRVLGAHMVGADAGPKSPARCTAAFQAF